MKVPCEVSLLNRQCPTKKGRPVKSTLAIALHPPNKEKSEMYLILFTPQNKCGSRYKTKNNISKVFTRFVSEGKATISFKEPEHDLLIKCDPVQMKCFLQTLKLGIEGKYEMNKIGLSNLSATALSPKSHPVTKFVVRSRGDYPLKGFPRTITSLYINKIDRCRVDSQILFLKNLTVLDLSENSISVIPKELGNMALREVNFAKNNLGENEKISDWKWLEGGNIQSSLNKLDISFNQLKNFPYNTIKLKNLVNLNISSNEIKRLPFAVRKLTSLRILDLSNNKLESLPSPIAKLRLDEINICSNPSQISPDTVRIIPTVERKLSNLWELAGRVVVSNRLPYSYSTIPRVMADFLDFTPLCECGLLCFSSKIYEKYHEMNFTAKSVHFERNQNIFADRVFCERCAFEEKRKKDRI